MNEQISHFRVKCDYITVRLLNTGIVISVCFEKSVSSYSKILCISGFVLDPRHLHVLYIQHIIL